MRLFTQDSQNNTTNSDACGVGLIVNLAKEGEIKASHATLEQGLRMLASFDYRAGFNPATQESDGAGLRIYGLPRAFFHRKIKEGAFILQRPYEQELVDERFTLGQYFFPQEKDSITRCQNIIEQEARLCGLEILGWRDLASSITTTLLSPSNLAKLPSLWQAIFLPMTETTSEALEAQALKLNIKLSHRMQYEEIPIHILSQSAQSVVYKGLLRAKELQNFFLDLQDADFTAKAVAVHARFATNTKPEWQRVQPCSFFWAHNGELNSAPANAREMQQELMHFNFPGIYPSKALSDSMQCDTDLLNTMHLHHVSLEEAIVRLMPPSEEVSDQEEAKAMLQYFSMQRTPYNGPAFAVMGLNNTYFAKLDNCGLRPSRWSIVEEEGQQQFIIASDAIMLPPSTHILSQGHLEPGAVIMTTKEGAILHTKEILEAIIDKKEPLFFSSKLKLITQTLPKTPFLPAGLPTEPYRQLYSLGWDYETMSQIINPMAELGAETTAAMGDDTDPLHAHVLPPHLSYFFHQLFAQVSSPALDSIREKERFSLKVHLGAIPSDTDNKPLLLLSSPFLAPGQLELIEAHPTFKVAILDITFPISAEEMDTKEVQKALQSALHTLVKKAEQAASEGASILILSDRNTGPINIAIPDLIAVAAVRKHLEKMRFIRNTSLIIDSAQIAGPHHTAALLSLGAHAIYPRAAYAYLAIQYAEKEPTKKIANYILALEKCLLKTMGKLGITEVHNYINGHFMAALGLDLTPSSDTSLFTLAKLFPFYSPLRGWNLSHIVKHLVTRHMLAYDPSQDFASLPRAGHFMPEKQGIKHGYGPEVINAFSSWLKEEELRWSLWRLDQILIKRGIHDFITDRSIFSPEQGFINPIEKSGDRAGFYPLDYLEDIAPSPAFEKLLHSLDTYKIKNPSSLRDRLRIASPSSDTISPSSIQSTASIRTHIFSGSMSQGALTVASFDAPEKRKAHETLTLGMNAVHAMSASGEGGEAFEALRDPLQSCRSKQIASGRFGNSAMQIMMAKEIEIKIAQGAKPGEGGEVPGYKISIRFAAQRGGLPGMPFISPPPHHDIYSIEDLAELIRDVKVVNPSIKVAVKLVASEGIGTIAIGVAKAGADVINIASHSGGTGAAQQSSIKHAGLPSELGLIEVDNALRTAQLRELVILRVSGGFKTADDIIVAAILGAEQFEFGTTAMLTLGCKMQRTCNKSCQPGVANNPELFQGSSLNVERYIVFLAASIQKRLKELGISSLDALRGRRDLLYIDDPQVHQSVTKSSDIEPIYDFGLFLKPPEIFPLSAEEIEKAKILRTELLFAHEKEAALVEEIRAFFDANPNGSFSSPPISLNSEDRSFGARVAGAFAAHLEQHPEAKIILHTQGIAGQSFGFVCPKGLFIQHRGCVEDGCGKSMTGGELIICAPKYTDTYDAAQNTIAGNAVLYGASHGSAFIEGIVGHRFGILMKGACAVIEGAGDLAFEYLTSGTACILGRHGKGLGTGASGGILFVYRGIPEHYAQAVRTASVKERSHYQEAILYLLHTHLEKTGSERAKHILETFHLEDFSVLIPKTLDEIQTLSQMIDILKTYQTRLVPLCVGMATWFKLHALTLIPKTEQKILTLWQEELLKAQNKEMLPEAIIDTLLNATTIHIKPMIPEIEDLASFILPAQTAITTHLRIKPDVNIRLKSIQGLQDEFFRDALLHIALYVHALGKDAQGCSSCRAQSCAGGDSKEHNGCPSSKPINTINATLKQLGSIDGSLTQTQWRLLREAFEHQIKESPFIAYTGAACPAPCQDACTETIPHPGTAESTRGGKHIGEAVHIKDIEYYLFLIGRAFGWFDGLCPPGPSPELLLGPTDYSTYVAAMTSFQPIFRKRLPAKGSEGKELIIVGSGPAAMQMAFEGLSDGIRVRMYEQSDKPGGLLRDGIPQHKFPKHFLDEDFQRLIDMGLELHLNTEVDYDPKSGQYHDLKGTLIADDNNKQQFIALCIGAGRPRTFSPHVTCMLPHQDPRIIQAIDFLKAANDIADVLQKTPEIESIDVDTIIRTRFGHMDPRGKRIIVIGGGDTAQDVIRWVARYVHHEGRLSKQELSILVRGHKPSKRAIIDAYPSPSHAPTKEHALRDEEMQHIGAETSYFVEPISIVDDATGKLQVRLKHTQFTSLEAIQTIPEAKEIYDILPREQRPVGAEEVFTDIKEVDLIITALGFYDQKSFPLVQHIEQGGSLERVFFAGDVAGAMPKIIVGAQASAKNTYYEQIRPAMGLHSKTLPPIGRWSFFPTAKKSAEEATSKSTLYGNLACL